MTSNPITALVLSTEGILRLAHTLKRPIRSKDVLDALGGDPGSVRRDLRRLREDFLMDITSEGSEGTFYDLSATGRAAVEALERAAGRSPLAQAGRLRWPLDKIKFNPDNVRKKIRPETLPGLADTIAEAEDLIQEIVLYPPDASGDRMLHAGERRVRACHLLLEAGRLPALLAEGLPFTERAGNRTEALFVALVENAQREDVEPWEDAKGLKAFKDETGLSARAIAFKLGRAREGAEEGVRDVQEKIRTVVNAQPDQIAAIEAGKLSFDALKRSIRKPASEIAAQLRPQDLLVMAEVMHRGKLKPKNRHYGDDTECSFKAEADPLLKGLVSQGLLRFTPMAHDDFKPTVAPGHRAYDLKESIELAPIQGQNEEARERTMFLLRAAVVGEERARQAGLDGLYITPWLNGPFEPSEKAKPKIEAAAAAKADTRGANKIKKARLEKKTAENRLIEEQLRETAFIGTAGSQAQLAVAKLQEQLADMKVVPPFTTNGRLIFDANGEAVLDVNWRFYDDKPLVIELIAMALNAAFAFPTARKDFLHWITGRLALCGLDMDLALKRAPRALDHFLEAQDCDFGDARHLWGQEQAAAIADTWFDTFEAGLPEDGYLAIAAFELEQLGWTSEESPALAAEILSDELKVHGVAFGNPNYHWDKADAQRLVRDFYAELPVASRPAMPDAAATPKPEDEAHAAA